MRLGRGLRITPACAGSTASRPSCRPTPTDHPRLRGEHLNMLGDRDTPIGSPPPARGAPGRRDRSTRCVRITPACAGSTTRWWPPGPATPDHPRLRGEHCDRHEPGTDHRGSPPPARGALTDTIDNRASKRITPACAGSTPSLRHYVPRASDHPRLRGEHIAYQMPRTGYWGSPPPARGAPRQRLDGRRGGRIPPACAGSTCATTPATGTWWDHPRLRGEHWRYGRPR